MADEIKSVSVSHLHEDEAGLADLKKLVEKGGLTIRDASINSSNPNDAKDQDYLESQILAPEIQSASTLLNGLAESVATKSFCSIALFVSLDVSGPRFEGAP